MCSSPSDLPDVWIQARSACRSFRLESLDLRGLELGIHCVCFDLSIQALQRGGSAWDLGTQAYLSGDNPRS